MSQNKQDKMTLLHIPDLTPWLDTILRLCLHPAVQVGFDRFLAALVGEPRTAKELTALLAEIETQPEGWAQTVNQHVCQPAEGWLTENQLAKQVGKSPKWVRKQVAEYFPNIGELRLDRGGNATTHFPHFVLSRLQELAEQHQSAEGWLTAEQITRVVQRSWDWVTKQLAEHFPNVGEVRLDRVGKPAMHYPRSALPRLQELALQYQSAQGWLTTSQMAKSVRRNKGWVKKQLTEHFPNTGEMRLDRGKHAIMHYPASVIPKLQELAEQYPPAHGWLTAEQIARVVQRSWDWVTKQLAEHFPNVGEVRLDPRGRAAVHFPPPTLSTLLELAQEHQSANGWLTKNQIAYRVKRDADWVHKRLAKHFPDAGEIRLDRGGHAYMRYPPSILPKLKELSRKSATPAKRRKKRKVKAA